MTRSHPLLPRLTLGLVLFSAGGCASWLQLDQRGRACTADDECEGDRCIDGACGTLEAAGYTCVIDEDCALSESCEQRDCVDNRELGACDEVDPCSPTWPCLRDGRTYTCTPFLSGLLAETPFSAADRLAVSTEEQAFFCVELPAAEPFVLGDTTVEGTEGAVLLAFDRALALQWARPLTRAAGELPYCRGLALVEVGGREVVVGFAHRRDSGGPATNEAVIAAFELDDGAPVFERTLSFPEGASTGSFAAGAGDILVGFYAASAMTLDAADVGLLPPAPFIMRLPAGSATTPGFVAVDEGVAQIIAPTDEVGGYALVFGDVGLRLRPLDADLVLGPPLITGVGLASRAVRRPGGGVLVASGHLLSNGVLTTPGGTVNVPPRRTGLVWLNADGSEHAVAVVDVQDDGLAIATVNQVIPVGDDAVLATSPSFTTGESSADAGATLFRVRPDGEVLWVQVSPASGLDSVLSVGDDLLVVGGSASRNLRLGDIVLPHPLEGSSGADIPPVAAFVALRP